MSAREQDENGFVSVKGCPISSFGIFEYSAAQLGMPGDPNRIVNVFRPESAVSDPATIDSFKNVPFIVDHEMLSGFDGDNETESPDQYGVDGVLTSGVYYEAPWLKGDLRIFSRRAQRALESGKKDLSLGYTCDFEVKSGVFNGKTYEAVQTNMRGNHIALVDQGRVPGARVLDGRSVVYDHLSFDVRPSKKDDDMKVNRKAADTAVEKLKALLPALEQFLNEEATEPAHQAGAEGEGAEGSEGAGAAAAAAAPAEGAEGTEGDESEGAGMAGAEGAEGAGGESATAGTEQDCTDVEQAIAQVEQILAELKAACGTGGGNEGQSGADDVEGLQESNVEGAGGSFDESGEEGASAADEGEGSAAPTNGGKASAGPAAGKHEGADSAVRRFYADLAAKDRLYNRLSAVVGAFDHAAMDAHQVAAYGVRKLGIKAVKGQERVALDGYLTGHEKANAANKQRMQRASGKAADSATQAAESEVGAYIKG